MPDGINARPTWAATIALAALALGGCTASPQDSGPIEVSLPESPTLRTLIESEPEHPMFELVQETTDYDGDQAEVVSFASGGLEVQAVIRRPPSGAADSPAIVFVHGDYGDDRDEYSGLTEYDDLADFLVDSGYTVVTPDLRNHGDSEDDPSWETNVDAGGTLDVVNAVRATAADPHVDPERIAIVGHSHGGALAIKAAEVDPGTAAAVVALAPSHAAPWEDIRHFYSGTPMYDTVVAAHGDDEESPEYWRDLSALTFIDRMTAPLLVVHGTADEQVPVGWSRFLKSQWTAAGKDVTLVELEGADHWMGGGTVDFTDPVTAFLAQETP